MINIFAWYTSNCLLAWYTSNCLLVWCGITLFGIIVTKLSLKRIYISNPEWWKTFMNVNYDAGLDRYFIQISHNTMNQQQLFVNYNTIFHLTLIIYAYGNIRDRFNIDGLDQLSNLLGYAMIPIFGFLGELNCMHFSITPDFFQHLTLPVRILVVAVSIFLLSFIGYQIYLSYLASELFNYLVFIMGTPLIYYLIYNYYLTTKSWHIHHWFIGFYLSLLARYHTQFTKIMMIIYYGIFLEGAICYGVVPVI